VVLTSRICASACDGFASAVRDLRLGTLIGTRTAGIASGPGQDYVLNDGSVLGLPARHAVMADKETIDGIGVAPDEVVPVTAAELSAGQDPDITAALRLLTRKS
jgi:carboxyl-terminal processing protease